MACEAEWEAYQLAISARIAAEILRDLAAANLADAQAAEWTACMAWWYCGSGARVVETHGHVPTPEEAQLGKQDAELRGKAARVRVERLKLEYQRLTGKTYEQKAAN